MLKFAEVDDAHVDYARWTMRGIVRMTYSNNWRVWMAGGSPESSSSSRRRPRLLRHDCGECTVPAQSGRRAIAIADIVRRSTL